MQKSKLALGTVQFGLDYGINNHRGKISLAEVFDILTAASAAGIDTLDTARAYGESESVLGRYFFQNGCNFKLVSKFDGVDPEAVAEVVTRSLFDIGSNYFYGYLIHDFESYRRSPGIWDRLKDLKAAGKIKKIGFSLYRQEELDYLEAKQLKIDILQVPYSVLDQRFERHFERLHKAGIEIHTRSVFLQGLLFKAPEDLGGHFYKIRDKIKRLHEFAKAHGVSIAALCLNYSLLNGSVDKVIVGVDCLQHLQELLGVQASMSFVKGWREELSVLSEVDENIILPCNWRQ